MLLSNPFMVDPRVYKEAKSLLKAGMNVTVIEWDRKKEYKTEDTIDDIHLIRIYNSFFMKLLCHDLFRNPFWWWHAFKKGIYLYKNGFNFDVVHCHDLDTLAIGVLLKKKLGVKLVYDAHEIFGYMITRDFPNIFIKFVFWLEKRLLQYSDHIIAVTDTVKAYLKSICDKPISIVMNCRDLIDINYNPPKNNVFTISYIGVLHKNRMFPDLIDIIGHIDKVRFVIAGKKENIYEKVEKKSLCYKNVIFLGTIPFNEVIPKTLESNAIICMFDPDDKNNQIGLPNKIFESMATGRPIIVSKGLYSGDFVQKNNCGIAVEYNANAVSNAIIYLRDNPEICEQFGRNGLDAVKDKYNWERQAITLINLYRSLF